MLARAKAFWEISRPVNVVITFASVGLGAYLTGSGVDWLSIAVAACTAGLICAGGNALNDLCDIGCDQINKPLRPLPSGRLSPKAVRSFVVLLFTSGVILAASFPAPVLGIAVGVVMLLVLYNFRLKRLPLVGNALVSLAAAASFPYGALAAKKEVVPEVWFITLFAFLFHFGREILKDLEDLPGDLKVNARTFPIRYGLVPTRRLVAAVFFVLALSTLIPALLKLFSWRYTVVVVGGVDLSLLYIVWSLARDASSLNLHRLSRLLKVDMVVSLLAVFLGVQ